MDSKNFEYLSNKLAKYEQLKALKEKLAQAQEHLCKDENLFIAIGSDESDAVINEICFRTDYKKLENECNEFFREIKDNLIDSIGMKIVEIDDKIKEL